MCGDGTTIILLRMKRRFQIYISFVENINDNHEELPESGLKRLRDNTLVLFIRVKPCKFIT